MTDCPTRCPDCKTLMMPTKQESVMWCKRCGTYRRVEPLKLKVVRNDER